MKEIILDLYFNQKLKQIEIANKLNITKGTVSKILNKEARFSNEKNERKIQNKIKHTKDIQRRVEEKRSQIQFNNNVDDLILRKLHIEASSELSIRKALSNENYRKWNYSAYKYNYSKNRFEFYENLGRSYDVPKIIKVKKY